MVALFLRGTGGGWGPSWPREAAFEVTQRGGASLDYRWLADGGRLYPGEDASGKLAAHGRPVIREATGRRTVEMEKAESFGRYLDRVIAAGTRVIAYAPPLHPAVFEDPSQATPVAELAAAMRSVTAARKVDFCDLTTRAEEIGCTAEDFEDELHTSRHCDERILWELANRCAPLAESVLHPLVAREILAQPR